MLEGVVKCQNRCHNTTTDVAFSPTTRTTLERLQAVTGKNPKAMESSKQTGQHSSQDLLAPGAAGFETGSESDMP